MTHLCPQPINEFEELTEGVAQVSAGVWHSLFLMVTGEVYMAGVVPDVVGAHYPATNEAGVYEPSAAESTSGDEAAQNFQLSQQKDEEAPHPFYRGSKPSRVMGLPEDVVSVAAGSTFSLAVCPPSTPEDTPDVYVWDGYPFAKGASERPIKLPKPIISGESIRFAPAPSGVLAVSIQR
eukprot:GHVN01092701.1.p1 GENE.GHVN01092701.1~~GHVN01092701.1.p1  ORF type:complete len:179 (-),score=24.43 GHVN01092701.1:411-947(-)